MNDICIITNGNDSQVPYMARMFESFNANNDTGYNMIFVAITDKMSEKSVKFLEDQGVLVNRLPKKHIDYLLEEIGSNQHPLGKIAKPFFIEYYLTNSANQNDLVVYCDPDMLLLDGLSKLLLLHNERLITVSQSLLPTASHACISRLYKLIKAGVVNRIDLPRIQPEICTGFFLGRGYLIKEFLGGWLKFMLSKKYNFLKNTDKNGFGWHDQDFFRCYHTLLRPSNLNILSPSDIIITNPPAYLLYDFSWKGGAVNNIEVKTPPSVYPPVMVHFAGGTYNKYSSINKLYAASVS